MCVCVHVCERPLRTCVGRTHIGPWHYSGGPTLIVFRGGEAGPLFLLSSSPIYGRSTHPPCSYVCLQCAEDIEATFLGLDSLLAHNTRVRQHSTSMDIPKRRYVTMCFPKFCA